MTGRSWSRRAAVVGTAVALMFGAPGSTVPGEAQGSWPFQIQWDHDGAGVNFYQLCVNGQCSYLNALRGEGTLLRAPLPILPKGEHRVGVEACGLVGCVAGTPDLMVRVVSPSARRLPIDVVPLPSRDGAAR